MTANEPDRLLMDADAWGVSGPPVTGGKPTTALGAARRLFGRPSGTRAALNGYSATSDDARREGTR